VVNHRVNQGLAKLESYKYKSTELHRGNRHMQRANNSGAAMLLPVLLLGARK